MAPPTQEVGPETLQVEEALRVDNISLSSEEQGHKVVLRPAGDAPGLLEMFVGGSEFASLAKEMGLIEPKRPLTHEMYLRLLDGFEIKFERLEIYDVRDNAFLARLHFLKRDQAEQLEVRPSDGLALAVHFGLPVFLNKRLLKGRLSPKDREILGDLVKAVKF